MFALSFFVMGLCSTERMILFEAELRFPTCMEQFHQIPARNIGRQETPVVLQNFIFDNLVLLINIIIMEHTFNSGVVLNSANTYSFILKGTDS